MDIDIDLKSDFSPEQFFNITHASMVEHGDLKKHLVGVYFQNVPKDKITGLCAIPYKEAINLGYFKIDFLHLSVLDWFDNKQEIKKLLKKEPNWDLLKNEFVVRKLFHISSQFDVVKKVNPRSIHELADVLALIRPGKLSLLNKYIKNKEKTRNLLYLKNKSSDLRKSHAIPYAMLIVLQLHLIEAGIL